jgi:hypothetical protein
VLGVLLTVVLGLLVVVEVVGLLEVAGTELVEGLLAELLVVFALELPFLQFKKYAR